jgi:hypothetical protein
MRQRKKVGYLYVDSHWEIYDPYIVLGKCIASNNRLLLVAFIPTIFNVSEEDDVQKLLGRFDTLDVRSKDMDKLDSFYTKRGKKKL